MAETQEEKEDLPNVAELMEIVDVWSYIVFAPRLQPLHNLVSWRLQ